MGQKVINVAQDFTRFPGGRFLEDGDKSGQAFREEYLEPALEANAKQKVKIQMDGVLGYGSSFLEEAFGGLVRQGKLSEEDFWRTFEIETSDSALLLEIKEYIREAQLTRNQ